MKVVKRSGKVEEYNCKKIKKAIQFACGDLSVNPLELEAKFDEFLFDGVTTDAIQSNLVHHAKNLASPLNDKWLLVAGRLATMGRWNRTRSYDQDFLTFYKKQRESGNWSHEQFNVYSDEEVLQIGNMILKDRDLQHTIASVETAESKYLNGDECIQHMMIGNAMLYASVEPVINRLDKVLEFYENLSLLEWSLASPQLMNLRKGLNNASCFIIAPEDDVKSIAGCFEDVMHISKNGGGLGYFAGLLRAKGSMLMGQQGASGGVVPNLKVFNDLLLYINQAGKRKGAGTAALPIWHNDILDFLDIQTEVGDPRSKCYDIQPQVTIFDLFMRKLEEDKNQRWLTFCPYEVKQVLGINIGYLFNEEFNEAYAKIEKAYDNGELKVVTEHKVNDLWKHLLMVFFERGRPYPIFIDKINRDNPNKHDGVILCANLCVAPETQILTDKGYRIISEVVGQKVNVWNGEEWSEVEVVKTSPLEEVVDVLTDDGGSLCCTKYHKWYVVTRDHKGKVCGYTEKRTHELAIGDELIKSGGFDTVKHGDLELKFAYESGFFTGDGCERGRSENKHSEITIYPKSNKSGLVDFMSGFSSKVETENYTTLRFKHGTLMTKWDIPDARYTLKSRLDWLSGLLDADGCILKDGESFVLNTASQEFANNLKLFLQEIGVDCTCSLYSNSNKTAFASKTSEDYVECDRKPLYVVRVHAFGVNKLLELGLSCNRLNLKASDKRQKTHSKFVKVCGIVDEGRKTPVFCFTEYKRNMGVFNGILTGQCVESFSNTLPDYYAHTCSLASLVVGRIPVKYLSDSASKLTRLLYNGMKITSAPIPESENHIRDYRTIGIGIQGMADILAREGKTYDDLDFITEVAERIQFGAVRESIQLAKERGAYPKFKGSRWDVGDIFDEYHLNSVCPDLDWLELKRLCKLYGMYGSQLTSPAPNTSTSIFMMAAAGFMPHYAEYFYEDNKDGKTAVSSMYLEENPLFYSYSISYMNQAELTKSVGAAQKFVDTGISAEYVLDRNVHEITALDVHNLVFSAWKNDNKGVYYLRTIKKGESLVKRDEICASCAG